MTYEPPQTPPHPHLPYPPLRHRRFCRYVYYLVFWPMTFAEKLYYALVIDVTFFITIHFV